MTEAQTEAPKTVIRPDISKMVKTSGGSYHKDDFIGNKLSGLTVDQVKTIGVELGVDVTKYAHLNPGQQRMNVGNALRRMAANPEAQEKIAALADPMHESNNAEKVAAANAKAEAAAAKKAEAEAKKAAKAEAAAAKKAKVKDDTEGEGSSE